MWVRKEQGKRLLNCVNSDVHEKGVSNGNTEETEEGLLKMLSKLEKVKKKIKYCICTCIGIYEMLYFIVVNLLKC